MLVSRGRLAFTMDANAWIARVEALPFLTFVPVDNRIALRAVQLESFANRDPADRIIVATAIAAGGTLITSDTRIRGYSGVKAVWD
jgi:PIN domain nuclease of toxin-antitoxin system